MLLSAKLLMYRVLQTIFSLSVKQRWLQRNSLHLSQEFQQSPVFQNTVYIANPKPRN